MSDVETAQRNLVDTFATVLRILTTTTLGIIKSGSEGKEGILSFFTMVLKLNKDRGKMQVKLIWKFLIEDGYKSGWDKWVYVQYFTCLSWSVRSHNGSKIFKIGAY